MISIALDGPAGAGKSTIAKAVARNLHYIYVDTGALYRAIAYFMLSQSIDVSSQDAVAPQLQNLQIDLTFEQGEQHVLVNGQDVSSLIRTPEVSMGASAVSALPVVRAFLLDLQRDMARRHNVIMDGRDIGTVVLPQAQVKLFLTASAEIRAQRRYLELKEKGQEVDFEEVLSDMKTRDYNDSHREIAPLKPAQDAVVVDTSNWSLEESIANITNMIKEMLP